LGAAAGKEEMNGKEASGKCLCGSVSFTVVLPTKWVAHCHCKNCQRSHGAAFVTWVSAEETQVAIHDPEGLSRWYASSNEADRGFCSHCGSSLFFRSVKWPGEIHIARALFTDPIDREPQVHGYYDTHVEWFTVTDDLPKKNNPEASGVTK
jgi:hypothetical protein